MLKLTNIRKSFGPVEVLKGINLELTPGETLGLVGENGAGKSTLMNILGGVIEASEGDIIVNGEPYQPKNVQESFAQGIAFIHQELNLFTNLTIKENLFVNAFPKYRGVIRPFINQQELHQTTGKLLMEVGLSVNPSTKVGELTNGQQQLVEIAKALKGEPKLIIFDEPTTALSQEEIDKLFQLITKLKLKQISMIYVSHNLEDVIKISDKIAVLRDGALINIGKSSEYSQKEMIRDMVGRDLDQLFPKRTGKPRKSVCLKVEDLCVDGVNSISFDLHVGEILGIYGLMGAGRSEMARGLFGLQKVSHGRVVWNGKKIDKLSPRRWIDQGVVFLTEDRREEGLLSFKGIKENVQLAALPKYTNRFTGWIDYPLVKQEVLNEVRSTRVKYQDLELQPVSTLSGGNQQKVLLSRWLMTKPKLIILDEPTKGIDVGAREEIYQLINNMVENGSSVLLISSEIEELLGMCDRIMVMNQGRLSAKFDQEHFDRSEILKFALESSEL